MAGTIRTYQKCPGCGSSFPSSKGEFPIICISCKTQPTKFFINVFWQGKHEFIYHDADGQTMHSWRHVIMVLGEIRARMISHKSGKGFFNPDAYKKQSNTSFQAFWDRFKKKHSGSTHEKVDVIGRLHLTYFNDMQMRDITSWQVDEWWQELADNDLSERYMNDILTWLKSFFNDALELEVIEKKPVFPKAFPIPEPDVDEWLSVEEQHKLFEYIPEHDRPIFDFLFITGCRVNEACALQRKDIYRDKGSVIIENTVKRDGSIGVVKNKKKRRIPYRAVAHCFETDVLSIAGFAFTNKWGRRYSDDYLRDTFNRACEKADIRRVKLKNATRHSAGMRMIEAGYDFEFVKDFFGHSSTRMTRHYAKVMDNKLDEMYETYSLQDRIKTKNNGSKHLKS